MFQNRVLLQRWSAIGYHLLQLPKLSKYVVSYEDRHMVRSNGLIVTYLHYQLGPIQILSQKHWGNCEIPTADHGVLPP